ncbi:uncharacterized protein LOC117577833 [Drosophila albomicans]|uniref:Uncharacterized protein LOC117577833 n=1 Tax=Drosophila albomicans TaxID=7291 RepID=A0A6P8Y5B5_DROAB|nr:uncharacterized protein LOC117577833 [Drosophila albomicans]
MGSIDSDMITPAGVLVPRLNPWEIMDWPSKQRRSIYRSWAQHFSIQRCYGAAQTYFEKCINEKPSDDDFRTLLMRNKFNRSIARPEEALLDSQKAATLVEPGNASVNLLMADALYDLNRFEDNKLLLHDNLRGQVGTTQQPFKHRLTIVNENFKDSVGDSMSPFLLRNSAKLSTIHELVLKPKKPSEPMPRWLANKNRTECDVQSLVEKNNRRISPLEAAWQQRKKKCFFQTYLHRSWVDVAFLKSLRDNPNVVLENYFSTAAERLNMMNKSCEHLSKFSRMLHARSPMYNEAYERMEYGEKADKFHEANMFRIQYQTRRNMVSILRTITALRAQNDIRRLRKFVEKTMGEYNVLKTTRVMPWKIEFMNEVYNHLALSLCESYRLPKSKISPYDNNSMCHLLGVSPLKPSEQRTVVFGDRSSYTYEDSGDAFEQAKEFKRSKLALENRLSFAKLAIERSYLLYELADVHMAQNQQVRCLFYAQKSIAEAKKCNSKIWEFLATMQQAKSHAILCKFERQSDVLDAAYQLAKELKSPQLCTFIELCRMLNRDYMTLRKMLQLVASKRLRSRLSNRSLTEKV